jgi:hypothetical protein
VAHTVTVGDLCFVAIGQIVNRHFDAVRYQPSGILIVSSPTRSPALREAVTQAWGSLTPQRHRASLVADFLKPDHEGRRVGACKRLAYYYPNALEPLALEFLARPTFSGLGVHEFVRTQLYREPDPERCRVLFDAFLARHGEASRDGILLHLFEDLLYSKEPDPPRRLLVQLYGWPKDVQGEDCPRVETLSDDDSVRLIEEGLIYDGSKKIDRAVRDLLVGTDDDYLGLACIKRLVDRGYDAKIEAYCRRLPLVGHPRDEEELQAALGKLGWTRLHVAVDRNDLDTAAALLRGKAKVNARARNGQTPLHLAAANGCVPVVELLLSGGAKPAAKDKSGHTPLDLAHQSGREEIIKLLEGWRAGP